MMKKLGNVSFVPSVVGMVGVVALGALGCAGEAGASPDVGETSHATATGSRWVEGGDGRIVASVTTRAGSVVRFVAGESHELGMAILRPSGVVDTVLDAAKRARATGGPLAFYEALTGQPAPPALLEAVKLASAPAPGEADASDEGEEEIAAPNVTAAAADVPVPSNFCDIVPESIYGKEPFIRCWPNQHGTTELKMKVDAMACRVDPVEGPLSFHYKYKTKKGWYTPYSVIGNAGDVVEYDSYYQWFRRWRECHVFKNDGEKLHHFRAGGFRYLKPYAFMPFEVHFP